jgi:hypothetical protein
LGYAEKGMVRRAVLTALMAETPYPLSKCLEVLESITPKAKKGYRDDMTAVLMKL